MRLGVVLLLLVVAAPLVAASAVEHRAEAAGCGSSPLGSNYRVLLRSAGVENCHLVMDAVGTATCAASACEFRLAVEASVSSGHPGERALAVFLSQPGIVGICADARSEGDVACEGEAVAVASVREDGCAFVRLHASYEENRGLTGTANQDVLWVACQEEGGATTLAVR